MIFFKGLNICSAALIDEFMGECSTYKRRKLTLSDLFSYCCGESAGHAGSNGFRATLELTERVYVRAISNVFRNAFSHWKSIILIIIDDKLATSELRARAGGI